MNTKVQHLGDLIVCACRCKSTSPIRTPIACVNQAQQLDRHRNHLQALLRRHARDNVIEEVFSSEPIHLATYCPPQAMAPPPPVATGNTMFSRLLQFKRPAMSGNNSQQPYHRDQTRQEERTRGVRDVISKFRRAELIRPKPENFQVTHESQHYYLSARMEHLQPSRMGHFSGSKIFPAPFPVYNDWN